MNDNFNELANIKLALYKLDILPVVEILFVKKVLLEELINMREDLDSKIYRLKIEIESYE